MVVQHNLTAMNSNRMLNITTSAQAKATEQLSSGYKINRAADDAAGLTISEKMRSQIRGLTQASSNAEDGVSCVQTAEGALAEVEDMLQRMNELAIKASNGTNTTADRTAIQAEVDALICEIDRVKQSTQFNTLGLLSGKFDYAIQVGAENVCAQRIKIKIDNICTNSLGTSKLKIRAIDMSKLSGAKMAITAITTAIAKISKIRSDLGAIQNRLEHTQNNLSVMTENIQDAEATIRDTDIADEMTTYTKNNILLQSAQAMLAQANQMPQGVLQLLQ